MRQLLMDHSMGNLEDPALQRFVTAHQAGNLPVAEDGYRGILARKPLHAGAWHYLSLLLWQTGRRGDAVAAAEKAVRFAPNLPKPRQNLGVMLMDGGAHDRAREQFAALARMAPTLPQGAYGLGLVAAALHRHDEAVTHFREAVRLGPNSAEAHYNLGCALKGAGDTKAAEAPLSRALALRAEYPEALCNLANVVAATRVSEAEAHARQALALRPDFLEATYTLGTILEAQTRLSEAEACYRRAVELDPTSHEAWSNFLFYLNYSDTKTPAEIAVEHGAWGARYAALPALPHDNSPDAGRRLKIGYVSPDFRAHSVSYFIEPVLAAHDSATVEVFAYACRPGEDNATRRLKAVAHHWRDISTLDDDAAEAMIRADGIDILVDLAGHTGSNRLPLFARRPSPVQMSWIGYPNSTGLAAMDWRMVDAITDPTGAGDDLASEGLLRLPGCFLCYQPPSPAPDPMARPEDGTVVFGSFNKLQKVTPSTLATWATILARVPGSRLMLKSQQLDDAAIRDRIAGAFAAHGIDSARLDLLGWVADRSGHLGLYNRIDVALDPFPYNGTTTTCEALWMGVPLVALRGDRHAARVGASLLTAVGVPELIAETREAYVDMAAALAAAPSRRAALRRDLRPRMAASPLCDAAGFCGGLEQAYRDAWRRWCG
jgi:predicted O-linked N-acetylglucosamine transferase (SPINDLY family)